MINHKDVILFDKKIHLKNIETTNSRYFLNFYY